MALSGPRRVSSLLGAADTTQRTCMIPWHAYESAQWHGTRQSQSQEERNGAGLGLQWLREDLQSLEERPQGWAEAAAAAIRSLESTTELR